MLHIGAVSEKPDDAFDVFRRQIVNVANFDKHLGRVDKEGMVIALGLLEHHDAGGNAGAEEKVIWKLNHTVNIVIIHQVFTDLAFGTSAVHDAREADDGSRAAGGKPAEAVHDECHIRFGFGRQHASRGKARVVDEQGVAVTCPLDGIGRVGDDGFERLIIFVQGVEEGVAQTNVELGVADVVQEHVDAAQVVGGQVDLLTEKALPDMLFAEDLGKVEQQRAGTASRVVDFVDFGFADQGQAGEQFGDVLGGEELAAAFAGVGGIHGHQEFVSVAKGVDVVILVAAEGHITNAVHQADQAFVAFHHGRSEFVAVDVDIVEEPFEVLFAFRA